ncbi:unnamed protein product, partial [marine sediment metagenome]
MTFEQAERFCEYFGHLTPNKVRITGGEPLMHPLFKEIIAMLIDTFTFSAMQITTNGLFLDESMFDNQIQFVVTPYLENEDIRMKFKDKITILPRPHGYFDRNHDPNLSEEAARKRHQKCLYKQIRIIGDNIYDCCHAQTMERQGKCPAVHAKVGVD